MPVACPWGAWTYSACLRMSLCTRVAHRGASDVLGPWAGLHAGMTRVARVGRGGPGHMEGARAHGGVQGFLEDGWGLWMEGGACGGMLVRMEEGGSVFGRGDMPEGEYMVVF